jgi:hypothetical protein
MKRLLQNSKSALEIMKCLAPVPPITRARSWELLLKYLDIGNL